jgi:hypothetical protein
VQTTQAGGAIRRLWPSERGKVRDHLLRLNRDDRLLRFGGYASAARITAYCDGLDWRRGLIVGYVTGGKVRGIGELKLLGTGWPRLAELAISVERRFHNRGIDTALLLRLVVAGRNRLIERLHMVCLMDNGRAERIAPRLAGTMRFAQGEAAAGIEPPWPTPWTWLEEALLASVVPGLEWERAALSRL